MTFDEWWNEEGVKMSDYNLAKAAWNKAIELAATQVEECEGYDFNVRLNFRVENED
jgi:hypothetical protein